METINLPYLLLNTRGFIIEQIQVEENELCLTLESMAVQGSCPTCDQESSQLHSTYLRYPRDLPWAEWPVRLHLRTKRFFCGNPKCPKKTFAERFPDFLARYARRTDRVRQKQQRLGVNVCARTAEKLLKLDQVGISDTTINRLLLDLPEPEPTTIRVLGGNHDGPNRDSGFPRCQRSAASDTNLKSRTLPTDPTRRSPTLRALTFAVTGRPEKCTEEHQGLLERICAEQPEVGEVITQARTFATLIREQQAEKLQDWLERSQTSSYRIWKNFAAGIEQDRQAVQAVLTHHWSNGPTKGHINRLKYLKRLMYGRAKDNLLRKRVLWQGKWGFT